MHLIKEWQDYQSAELTRIASVYTRLAAADTRSVTDVPRDGKPVFAFAGGHLFTRHLRRPGNQPDLDALTSSGAIQALAAALRCFHELAFAEPTGPLPTPGAFPVERQSLAELVAMTSSLPGDLASQTAGDIAEFGAIWAAGGLAAMPRGHTHGDLRPSNVILDEKRVYLIDFEGTALRPRLADLTGPLLRAVARSGGRRVAALWLDRLLDEYGVTADEHDLAVPMARWGHACDILGMVLYWQRSPGLAPMVMRLLERKVHRARLVYDVLGELDRVRSSARARTRVSTGRRRL